MDVTNLIMIMSLAFGFGMLHALDADHIMAVSGLIAGQGAKKRNINFCLRWAMGHGAVLMMLGTLVFLFGYHLPETISIYAELTVGVLLILIGCLLFFNLLRVRAHLHFHHHDGMPAHAHWHRHENSSQEKESQHHQHHAAILIGIVHGLAGSAPLLALIPVSGMASPVYGFTYLLIFSIGVVCAMLIFGGFFGQLVKVTRRRSERALRWLRLLTGTCAILSGILVLRSVQL